MSKEEDDVDKMLKEKDNEEVFEKQIEPNNVIIEPDEPVKKPKKKRKPLSEERKAQLRENLRKGRATSLKNRQSKAVKNKVKKEKLVDTAKGIVEGKYNNEVVNQKLMDKITRLEEMMINMSKPKPKPVQVNVQKPIEKTKPINIPVPVPARVSMSTLKLKNFWE